MSCATCALWYGRPVSEQLNWHGGMLGGLHDFTPGLENQIKILRAAELLREVEESLKNEHDS
jgi:hypothetical protein